ncbi:protein ORGAN SIZE RELATED 1-like [Olea europaea var. sylvestris]|uniref:protein ORGAN SIZE RELATED 1-like n=1 Tax=Olea europaea var. sylvestris TaxID=158386 RepID=UPI000C1D30B2|nr:protein ORGAN SIZE RELATED 1-like [Olea europaea var. sylvestris]
MKSIHYAFTCPEVVSVQLMDEDEDVQDKAKGSIFEVKSIENQKPLENLMFRNYSLRRIVLMVLLTVSLLVLPLVLPPLPPPPPILLLVPVLIMVLLILLAFSPSKLPNIHVHPV